MCCITIFAIWHLQIFLFSLAIYCASQVWVLSCCNVHEFRLAKQSRDGSCIKNNPSSTTVLSEFIWPLSGKTKVLTFMVLLIWVQLHLDFWQPKITLLIHVCVLRAVYRGDQAKGLQQQLLSWSSHKVCTTKCALLPQLWVRNITVYKEKLLCSSS